MTVLLLSGCKSTTAPVLTRWEADLIGGNHNFVGGRVLAVTQFGSTEISIIVDELEPDLTYGWRIDSGTCVNSGTIQGEVAAYPSLNPTPSGSASSETTISSIFHSGSELAARVFRTTESGSEVVVACGVLQEI